MYTFKKQERLCNKKHITNLFASKNGYIDFPLSVRWEKVEKNSVPVKVLIVVSKKNFKRAVDRNRIKRLLREAYRLNKAGLWNSLGEKPFSLDLCLNYIGKEMPVYGDLEQVVKNALPKLTAFSLEEK